MPKLKEYNLSEMTFANILLNLRAFKLTGWLEARTETMIKKVFLNEGRPISACSTDEQDKIGMILVSQGKLSLGQLKKALQEQTTGKRIGTLLIEQSIIKIDDLLWAVTAQAKQIICSLFDWEDGKITVFQEPLSGDIVKLSINADRIIIDGIRSINNPKIILRGLGDMETRVKITHVPLETLRMLQLSQEEQSILSNAEEKELSIRQICQMNTRPTIEICRLLSLLHASGCLTQV